MTIGKYTRLSKKNRPSKINQTKFYLKKKLIKNYIFIVIENIYTMNPGEQNLPHIETSNIKENYESNPSINSTGTCSLSAIQENQVIYIVFKPQLNISQLFF